MPELLTGDYRRLDLPDLERELEPVRTRLVEFAEAHYGERIQMRSMPGTNMIERVRRLGHGALCRSNQATEGLPHYILEDRESREQVALATRVRAVEEVYRGLMPEWKNVVHIWYPKGWRTRSSLKRAMALMDVPKARANVLAERLETMFRERLYAYPGPKRGDG
jgi:hypothetical protein